MLEIKIKICKKCGRPYVVKTGGYVKTIPEPEGICKRCEIKDAINRIKKVFDKK